MTRIRNERFSRNIGIMDHEGLDRLRKTSVAIGGLGLGGSVFLNLVRLGFENFHVADPDVYERGNINRQRLASEPNIGRRKDDCLIEEARAINPEVKVRAFRDGVNRDNVSEFLEGIDWVVDVVDLFAMEEKLRLNQEARRRGLPLVTCGTTGFTACMVVFENSSDSPTFEELSGIHPGDPYADNCRRFVNFLVPQVPPYMLAQMEKALAGVGHLPFVVSGVEATAAAVAAEIAKAILGIGHRVTAPMGVAIDLAELRVGFFQADHRKNDAFRRDQRGTQGNVVPLRGLKKTA